MGLNASPSAGGPTPGQGAGPAGRENQERAMRHSASPFENPIPQPILLALHNPLVRPSLCILQWFEIVVN